MSRIDERHPQYLDHEFDWFATRCAVKGPSAVKRQNTLFLPMPSAMSSITPSPSNGGVNVDSSGPIYRSMRESSPNSYPSNPAYAAYKTRAEFPDITSATMHGLIGIATAQPVDVQLPKKLEYLIDLATIEGDTLEDLYTKALSEVLQTARYTLCIDVDEDTNLPHIIPYTAESLVNWKEGVRGGKKQKLWLVFEESISTNPDDFTLSDEGDEETQRVLYLNEAGNAATVTYKQGVLQTEERELLYMGKPLKSLPAVVIGSTSFNLDCDAVPLFGIADVAYAMYRKSADMSQAEFLSANPMLVLSGVDKDEAPTAVGSTVALVLENSEAKAYYTQTDASGLQFVMNDIERLKEYAMSLGASLLGGAKKAAESGEALRLRQEAAGATLKSVVLQVGRGIERTLKTMAEWIGANPDDVVFTPNTEFTDITLNANEMNALLQSWLNGGISYKTYHWNIQRSGYVPDDVTYEDEEDEIENEKPKLTGVKPIPQEEPPEEELGDEDAN